MKREEHTAARFEYIDWLKSVGISLVVFYHATLYAWDPSWELSPARVLVYFVRAGMSVCVPVFFFVNGFLLLSRPFRLRAHARRTIRLTALTLFWGAVTLALQIYVRGRAVTAREFLLMLWNFQDGWINHLWFMGALVCIYVLFPLLKAAYDHHFRSFVWFTAVCGIMCFGGRALNLLGSALSYWLTGAGEIWAFRFFTQFDPFRGIYGYTFVYFCAGGLAARALPRMETRGRRRTPWALAGLAVCTGGLAGCGIFFSRMTGQPWDITWGGYDTMFTLANVLFLFMLALEREQGSRPGNRLAAALARDSLGIYFLHMLLIELTKGPLRSVPAARTFPGTVLYALAVTAASLVLTRACKKLPLLRRLL